MSKHFKTTLITVQGQTEIRMVRSYTRAFGGGTHEKQLTMYQGKVDLDEILKQVKELAASFPEYNPNPEVLDPVHRANLDTIERVNTDADLYP